MLQIWPTYENCNKALPYDSNEAMICTFECTYCKDCVDTLQHVYRGFEKRPVRSTNLLKKYTVSTIVVCKSVDMNLHLQKLKSR